MDREQALSLLSRDCRPILAGQAVTAAYFEASDGPGVAQLFYSVYGDGYPIDTYYIPERLIEENRLGNIRSVVARTEVGDVVAHVALYRSSPPNPQLFEYGLGVTLPSYRNTTAFFRANQLLLKLVGHVGVDGFFGEAVCNHTTTQKLSPHVKAVECAIQPALMPAKAYSTEGSAEGRVGCLVFSRVDNDLHRVIWMPSVYLEQLLSILTTLSLDREIKPSEETMPRKGGDLLVNRFDFAGVARCRALKPGQDLEQKLDDLELTLRKDSYAMIQVFVDLGSPWSGDFVNLLRGKGYCFGGLLPIWFGTDGLLMQKHFVDPDFQGLKILSDQGRAIVALAQKDWETQIQERS